MEIEYSRNMLLTKVVYWEKCDLCTIDNYLNNTDTLEVLYPLLVSDDIYEKYKDIMSFVEYKGRWGDDTHSLEIDLSLPEETILRQFGKTTIYEVRRANERDEVTFTLIEKPGSKDIEYFFEFYDCFAKSKNRAPIDRARVCAFLEAGLFEIAEVHDQKGELLVAHGYIVDEEQRKVSLFTSSSLFRTDKEKAGLVSRANRWLHYQSMISFKEKGYLIYDMGGLYIGDENVELARISSFKKGFGGRIIDYKCSYVIHKKEAEIIEKELASKIEKNIENDIVIWGASWRGLFIKSLLETWNGPKIKCFIDNSLAKSDDEYVTDGVLDELDVNKTTIIIATSTKAYVDICAKPIMSKYLEREAVVHFG